MDLALYGAIACAGALLLAVVAVIVCACRLKKLCAIGGSGTTRADDLCGAMFTLLFLIAFLIIALGFFGYCYYISTYAPM